MRFRLIEKYLIEQVSISKEIIDEFDTLGSKESKIRYIRDHIIGGKGNTVIGPDFRPLDEIIETSIMEDGLNRSNDFLYFVLDWNNKKAMSSSDANKKFTYLHDAHKNNQLDINSELYENESLFNRPLDEFKYTVNILNMMNQGKLGEYLRDPDLAELKHLYKDGQVGGELKDAGIKQKDAEGKVTDPNKAKTIFSTVEVWSRTPDAEGNTNAFSENDIVANKRNKNNQEEEKEIKKISKTISELPEEDKKRIMDDIKKAAKKAKNSEGNE